MKSDKKIKVVITGGGTGGHIYPAVAIVQKLKVDSQIEKIWYIGCPVNMEKEIAEREGVEFLPISISGMPRKNPLSLIKWYIELNKAVGQSLRHLQRTKPDIVFGTGGYVSGPVLLAAIILRIPFVIHDSDAKPGIVSRFIAPWAKTVFVAFDQAKSQLNSKNVIVNGNPLRSNFNEIDKDTALKSLHLDPSRKTILVIGGSQGAKTINEAVINSVKELIEIHRYQIIHQTGKKNFDECLAMLAQVWPDFRSFPEYIIRPFYDEMVFPLMAADLAISRAGSLSISELNLTGLPAILVPYPYAAANHQRFNALAMQKADAAIMIEDKDLNPEILIKTINELFSAPEKLKNMRESNKKLAKPKAADIIVETLKKFA